jgi:putative ABC transport system substrate-binding protein
VSWRRSPPTGHRIGWLRGFPDGESDPREEAFRQGLHDLGYVEGRNLVLEGRKAEGRVEQLSDLAAELVRLPVEVLVARGAPAIRAAQQATRTIPIVMAGTSDAVELGFVASLVRPGGNITGVSWLGAELPGKRLELLKDLVPQRADRRAGESGQPLLWGEDAQPDRGRPWAGAAPARGGGPPCG